MTNQNSAAKAAMQELKPCPFCGGPVELENTINSRSWWGVVCRNARNRGGTCAIQTRPSASKEVAIERWNMRAPVADEREVFEEWLLTSNVKAHIGYSRDELTLARAAWDERARRAGLASAPVADESTIRRALVAASNYIDTLGGDSRSYRVALASAPVAGEAQSEVAKLAEELGDLASDMAYEANQEMDQEKATRAAIIERGERALRRLADAAPQASECECSRKSKAVSDSEAQL